MAITKEQVWAAAEELAAEGLRPTLEAVRQRIGGSYTTIGPALNEWKARHAEKASPVREPPPPAVAERLAEVGWPADTPVVAISRAGWPDERFSRHTVATLAEADALHHGRPTLVTVGAGARPVLPDDAHGAHDPDQAPAPASVA